MLAGTNTLKGVKKYFQILKVKDQGVLVRLRLKGMFLDGMITNWNKAYFQYGKSKVNYLLVGDTTPMHLRGVGVTKKTIGKQVMIGTTKKPINIWRGYETLRAREDFRSPAVAIGHDR